MEYPIFEDPPFDVDWFLLDSDIEQGEIDPDPYDSSFPLGGVGCYYFNTITKHIWYHYENGWKDFGVIDRRKSGESLKLKPGIYDDCLDISYFSNNEIIDKRWNKPEPNYPFAISSRTTPVYITRGKTKIIKAEYYFPYHLNGD